MKVRCIKLLGIRGENVNSSSWAKVGGVYHVLGISIDPRETKFRLIGDEPVPALFELEMFEVVSSVIPSTWRATSPSPGRIELGPEAWSREGFWVRFFNREPDALESFANERARILAEEP